MSGVADKKQHSDYIQKAAPFVSWIRVRQVAANTQEKRQVQQRRMRIKDSTVRQRPLQHSRKDHGRMGENHRENEAEEDAV